MDTYEAELSKLRLIARARQLLNDEFVKKRADEYTTWLNVTKDAWKTPHTSLPYPPFAASPTLSSFQSSIAFPSEEDIVNKALELYNEGIAAERSALPPTSPAEAVPSVVEPIVQLQPESGPELELEPIIEAISPASRIAEAVIIREEPTVVEAVVLPATRSIADIFAVKKDSEAALPQPAELLHKVSHPGPILPSIFEKLQQVQADFGDASLPRKDYNNV